MGRRACGTVGGPPATWAATTRRFPTPSFATASSSTATPVAQHAGPGGWNDPDYVLSGYMAMAPRAIGADAALAQRAVRVHVALVPDGRAADLQRRRDPAGRFTLSVLCNDEVIDVDQDPLGRAARRVAKQGDTEVWARELEDGTKAVGLFNHAKKEATVACNWSDLGVKGRQTRAQPVAAEGRRAVRGPFLGPRAAARRRPDPPDAEPLDTEQVRRGETLASVLARRAYEHSRPLASPAVTRSRGRRGRRPLHYRHRRRAHFRLLPSREVAFVRQATVRSDLPPPPSSPGVG